ncbi:MAG: hypothetical protein ACKOD9_17560, partial [Rubrivivax sp.]
DTDRGAGACPQRHISRTLVEGKSNRHALDDLHPVAGRVLGGQPGDNYGNPGPDAALLMRRHRWPGIELSQDGTNYFDVHHTDNDTLDRIDPAALRQNVACWAAVAWLAAQSRLSFG